MLRSAVLLISLLIVSNTASADERLENVRTIVADMFDIIEPKNITKSPVEGWYMIQKSSVVAYISEDGKYLLQGDMIDLEANLNLSEEARNDGRRELMSSVQDSDAIIFSPDEPKYSVTVFTDVDCTYCRRLHNQIDEYLDQGIEIRYLLYPRNGPTSRSWSTSENVSCARDKQAALTSAKADESFEVLRCDSTMVAEHYALGREVGLSGTPAIVLDDGTLIGGYVPPAQLKQRLDQSAARNAGS